MEMREACPESLHGSRVNLRKGHDRDDVSPAMLATPCCITAALVEQWNLCGLVPLRVNNCEQ